MLVIFSTDTSEMLTPLPYSSDAINSLFSEDSQGS